MDENTNTPKFNMALATLQRMDLLLRLASEKSLKKDYLGWYDALFTLRREIFPFIKPTEYDEVESLFKELAKKQWCYGKGSDFRVIPNELGRLIWYLDKINLTINKAMDSAGILMPKHIEGGWD
jgi:hypothetical protein